MNFRFVSWANHVRHIISKDTPGGARRIPTMRCELDSCGFWLYFFLRIDRTD